MLIDTERFERCFEAWVRSFGAPLDREVVAIDGKTIRGSFDRGREQGPLHVVSAWACDRQLVLGQRQVGDKSNEISAIPELLDVLDIKGAIVTLDAMGCQRAIATRILKRGADYLVTLKANQGKKFTAVQELCATTCFSRSPLHRPLLIKKLIEGPLDRGHVGAGTGTAIDPRQFDLIDRLGVVAGRADIGGIVGDGLHRFGRGRHTGQTGLQKLRQTAHLTFFPKNAR